MKTLFKFRRKIAASLFVLITLQMSLPLYAAAQTLHAHQDRVHQKIQLALLLDTSNSMDGLIDQAKSQLWKIVNEMAKAKYGENKPDLEIALYEYGNDNLSINKGYIRKLSDFTTDLDTVSELLFGLRTNGGSEYCGEVIQTAHKNLRWDDARESLKIIFIAGNEPFNQGKVNYVEACSGAKNQDILINTIFCGNYQEGVNTFWKKGADVAGGSYMNIDQDQKTVYINTPYDEEIMQLNIQLNRTYIGYGKSGASKKAKQAEQDKNASSYGQANAVERATSKTKHVYKSESWDLVDATKSNPAAPAQVKEDELPEEMKKMTVVQRKTYIDAKAKDRADIQKKMSSLEGKRNTFIVQEKAKKPKAETASPLEDAMLNSVKKAAGAKNMKFD